MADNENDLGGKVGLDITDFKANVAELNRQIRVVDSGFKAAAAGMGDWGASAEGLQSRIDALNRITDLQKQKVQNLTAQYEKVAAEKGADSKAAQDLEIRINKETESLNKNQKELRDVTGALDNFGKEADDASEKTSKFTSHLRSIAGGVGKAAVAGIAAIGAAAASAAVGAFKLAEKASDLSEAQNVVQQTFKTSSDSVIAWTKTVQESAGISQTNATKFVGSMGAMLKSSGLSKEASADMAKSLVQLTGDMSSFYNLSHEETWEKIRSGISGETEPLKQLGINMSVANMEAFALSQGINKSWNEMSQAEQTTLRYQYLMKATADAQGDFGRTLETSFPNQLRVAQMQLESMATSIGQKFLPAFLDIFKSINQGFRTGDWSQVGASISAGLTSAIAQVTNAVPTVSPIVTTIITGIITAIVASVPQILPPLIQAVLQLLDVLIQTITQNGPMLIRTGIQALMMLVNGLIQALPQLIDAAIKIILALVDSLVDNLPQLIPVAIQAIVTLAQGIISALPQLAERMPKIIETIVKVIIENFPLLVDVALKIILALTAAIIENLPLIIQAALRIIGVLVCGILGGIVDIVATVPIIFSNLVEAFKKIEWRQLGVNLINGIVDGVKGMAANLANSVVEAAKRALDAAKEFLGIQSPSTVMRDQVGKMIGAGMAEGIGDSVGMVNAAMKGLNKELVEGETLGISRNVNVRGVPATAGNSPLNRIAIINQGTIVGTNGMEEFAKIVSRQISRDLGLSTGGAW